MGCVNLTCASGICGGLPVSAFSEIVDRFSETVDRLIFSLKVRLHTAINRADFRILMHVICMHTHAFVRKFSCTFVGEEPLH